MNLSIEKIIKIVDSLESIIKYGEKMFEMAEITDIYCDGYYRRHDEDVEKYGGDINGIYKIVDTIERIILEDDDINKEIIKIRADRKNI